MVLTDDATLSRALDYADRWLAYRCWRLRLPGVQAAVRVGGALVLETAHGVAEAASGEPLTPQHRFRIASHSKSLAALAAMRLVEQGRLRLDDAAQDRVPALHGTEAGRLQVRELLSHGSGAVRDGDDVAFWHLQAPFPDAERLLAIAAAGVARVPASAEFKYSNVGFGLLGLVIEAVTGTAYEDALRQLVLAPLGREDVTADLTDDAAQLVTGHSALHSSEERRALGSPRAGALAAATGAVATASQLTDVLRTVTDDDDRLLGAEAKRRMRQQQWTTAARDGGAAGYALGLMLRSIDGREWVGHGGAWTGQATRTLVDVERDIVVSVLANAIDAPAEELAVGVARLIDAALDDTDPAADETLHLARSFEGTFSSLWARVDVVELGGRLLVVSPTAADPMAAVDVLTPLDDDRVRVAAATGMGSGHEIAVVERNAVGRVVRWRGAMHLDAVEER
ncbi:serine hydrolase domain-containing protein [Agrococcus sp. Ld7]|uniref:serine hydrolase domain-containing protein n=1 Tax=Agrococcus sp. Ld7 TaxID=649148 RepID=UPI00386591E9